MRLPLRRWRQDRRGATAVEFAIIGPLFLLLVLGTIDFGIELMTQLELDNAVHGAAREIKVGQATDLATFKSDVCSHASVMLASCSAKLQIGVTSGATFAGLTPATVSGGGVLSSAGTYNIGGGSAVLVQVAYTRPYLTNWLTKLFGSTPTLLSTFAIEQEPS